MFRENRAAASALQRAIPFIDPIDVRYNRFTRVVVPRAKAVMFCLMDVSASMGEREKDLAKRFFILLHLFLKRKYERVDDRLHPPHPRGRARSTSTTSSTAARPAARSSAPRWRR